jgi:hypothetical protein
MGKFSVLNCSGIFNDGLCGGVADGAPLLDQLLVMSRIIAGVNTVVTFM